MRLNFSLRAIALAAGAMVALQGAHAQDADDDVFYFIGITIKKNLEVLNLSEAEADLVVEGLTDALAGKEKELDLQTYNQKVQQLTQERFQAAAAEEAEAGAAYVAEMAKEAGAEQSDSGLVYIELEEGDGEQPTATSQVRAHYKGTLRDGTVFDSSYERGEPITIGLNQVIPCWTEGMVKMREGGKARLVCPSEIAYGPRGQGRIPANAALSFEVELLEVLPAEAP